MSACPADEELRRYLDREDAALGADRRQEIEGHVERCARCQELLERWVSELEAGLPCGNSSVPAPTEPSRSSRGRSESRVEGVDLPPPGSFPGRNEKTTTLADPGPGRGGNAGGPGGPTAGGPGRGGAERETDLPGA